MKFARTKCIHCNASIGVENPGEYYSWGMVLQTLLFRKANHELMHLLNGTDVYSQMEKGMKNAIRDKDNR